MIPLIKCFSIKNEMYTSPTIGEDVLFTSFTLQKGYIPLNKTDNIITPSFSLQSGYIALPEKGIINSFSLAKDDTTINQIGTITRLKKMK